MRRYIDAGQIVYTWLIDNDGKEHDGVTLQSVIDMMPTADVVEVVRCKDCRHYSEEGKVTRYSWCYKWKNAVNFGDFCSYGERADI